MSEQHAENKAVVNIFGEDYPITGVTDPSHISKVADYVDSKMRDVANSSRVNGRDRIAILAAMSIASELFETRCRMDDIQDDIESKTDGLLKQLDEALS